MLTGFDHFIVLVNDLNAAISAFQRLGFDARAGGEHPAFGSRNALVPFADGTYIELVAFHDTTLAANSFWRTAVQRLQVSEGFGGYALLSDNITADVARVNPPLSFGGAQTGARVRPDGQRVEWYTSMYENSPVGLMPFLIQDETPRRVRIEPATQGMGARARVKEVIVVVKNAEQARDGYQTLLGVESKHVHNAQADVLGYRFLMNWGSIVLAHPEKGGNTMSEFLAARGEGIFALTLEVDGLGHDRIRFRNDDIVLQPDGSGFLIPADAACGARIRLVAK
jgi:hypothetical protein